MSPLIEVRINAKDVRKFIVDTGASNSSVHPIDAAALKLADAGGDTAVGSTGNVMVRLAAVAHMEVAGLARRNLTVAVVEGPRFDDPLITGLMGTDMFEGAIVHFDFARDRLALLKRPPRGRNWAALPSQWLRPWKIMVPIRVNGVDAMAFVDSGAQHSVANLALATAAGLPTGGSAAAIGGLSGDAVQLQTSLAGRIEIGPWQWTETQLSVGQIPVFERLLGADVPQLMLGADLLRGRSFVIDYGRQQLWLARR